MTSEDTNVDSATDDSRRRFLAGTAGALGGVALGGAFATPALAHEQDDEDDEADETPPRPSRTSSMTTSASSTTR
ncbi:hypothetical protein ACFQER_03395 [Halomicroarcula sp. GCM10025894]|uniref:hypothetical protein n=1 Tax=Halomicroarcula sp. GCM10025894 TaxID=3252673 RepID=UPI00361AB4AB